MKGHILCYRKTRNFCQQVNKYAKVMRKNINYKENNKEKEA